ncbi:MAG: hypothetical protein Q9215_005769 [Flavoplaca cf. flavocitrina]
MAPLLKDTAEYRALIRLADLLTQRVVTWLARELRHEDSHKSTGNAYHKKILETAPEIARQPISIPEGLPETLQLAIIFRRQAMEFDKKKVRQNPKAPAKKTKQAKNSSQRPAKKHHKANKKLKKHGNEVQIAEKSLKHLVNMQALVEQKCSWRLHEVTFTNAHQTCVPNMSSHLLRALNLAATTVAGPADDQDDEDDHEENTTHTSDADDGDEELDPYPLQFPLEDFDMMLEAGLVEEEEIQAHNDWVSRRNLANAGLISESSSESESESSDE